MKLYPYEKLPGSFQMSPMVLVKFLYVACWFGG